MGISCGAGSTHIRDDSHTVAHALSEQSNYFAKMYNIYNISELFSHSCAISDSHVVRSVLDVVSHDETQVTK